MSDYLIHKLHRAMRIGFNRTGEFPTQPELAKKLNLKPMQLNILMMAAKDSAIDILPDTFELRNYCKLNTDDMTYGTKENEEFKLIDFLEYKNLLNDRITNLDFGNDNSTEDVLEVAGTIVNYLEILITKITNDDSADENHIEREYEEVMTIYGRQKFILTIDQLQISIDSFLEPFGRIFFKVGLAYEAYNNQIEELFNEKDIIKEYHQLNFKEIESFLKLYEDGQLD